LPKKLVLVPRIAELPGCQNTLQFWPLLITCTTDLLAVVSVLPFWKIKMAYVRERTDSPAVKRNTSFIDTLVSSDRAERQRQHPQGVS
jgi:hypothetical protein